MENNIRIWLNLKFYICMHLSLAAQVLYNECEMQPQILKTKDFLRQIKYYSHCGVSERSRKKLFLVNSIFPFNQTVFGKKKIYLYINEYRGRVYLVCTYI